MSNKKKAERFEITADTWFSFKDRCEQYFVNNEHGKLTISLESSVDKRSSQQNMYYWGVVIAITLKFYVQNVRVLIEDTMEAVKFKLTKGFVHELFKMLFNGGRTTRKLDPKGMIDYWNKIREKFLDRGVDIPPPNEPPIEELQQH